MDIGTPYDPEVALIEEMTGYAIRCARMEVALARIRIKLDVWLPAIEDEYLRDEFATILGIIERGLEKP